MYDFNKLVIFEEQTHFNRCKVNICIRKLFIQGNTGSFCVHVTDDVNICLYVCQSIDLICPVCILYVGDIKS